MLGNKESFKMELVPALVQSWCCGRGKVQLSAVPTDTSLIPWPDLIAAELHCSGKFTGN